MLQKYVECTRWAKHLFSLRCPRALFSSHFNPNFNMSSYHQGARQRANFQTAMTSVTALIYEGANTIDMISVVGSMFRYVQEKISPVQIVQCRLKLANATQVAFGSTLCHNLRRCGDYMLNCFAVTQYPGFVAKLDTSDSEVVGKPASQYLPVDAHPHYDDYAGITAIASATLRVGPHGLASVTSDAILCVEELMGAAGRSARPLVGKYGDAAERARRSICGGYWVTPLNFFWSHNLGFAMPLSQLQFGNIDIEIVTRPILDLIVKPAVANSALSSAGTDDWADGVSADLWDIESTYGSLELYFLPGSGTYDESSLTTVSNSLAVLNDSHMQDQFLLGTFAHVTKYERATMHASSYMQQCWFFHTQTASLVHPSGAGPAEGDDALGIEVKGNCKHAVFGAFFLARTADAVSAKKWTDFQCDAPSSRPQLRRDPLTRVRLSINESDRVDISGYELYDVQPYSFASTSSALRIGVCSFAPRLASTQPNGWLNMAKILNTNWYFDVDSQAFASAASVSVSIVYAYWNTVTYTFGNISMNFMNQIAS